MEYEDLKDAPSVTEGTADTTEEAFLQGYLDEEDMEECAECGEVLREKTISKTFEGEMQQFCSADCVEDYEESM